MFALRRANGVSHHFYRQGPDASFDEPGPYDYALKISGEEGTRLELFIAGIGEMGAEVLKHVS